MAHTLAQSARCLTRLEQHCSAHSHAEAYSETAIVRRACQLSRLVMGRGIYQGARLECQPGRHAQLDVPAATAP